MKNNKGFTLVEVIIVVALIAILFTIAIPSALKFSNNNKNKLRIARIQLIEEAAIKYGQDNDDRIKYVCTQLPSGVSSEGARCLEISIKELVEYNYVTEQDLINPNTNLPFKGGVEIQYYYNRYYAVYHNEEIVGELVEIPIEDAISELYGDDTNDILILLANPYNSSSTKSLNVEIYVDPNGLTLDSNNIYEYYLSENAFSLIGGTWQQYEINKKFTIGDGLDGDYFLFVRQINTVEGVKSSINDVIIEGDTYHRFATYKFDNTSPEILISQDSSQTFNKNLDVNITIYDPLNSNEISNQEALSPDNVYEYYLSNNSNNISGGSWKTYEFGNDFTIGNNLNGAYYLFVKVLRDIAENIASKEIVKTINGEYYYCFGPYLFDNTSPTITVSPYGTTTLSKDLSVTITANDNNGVLSENNYYYLSPYEDELRNGRSGSYNNGVQTKINTNNLTGLYYLYVRSVEDQAGNVSILNNDIIVDDITYHRFGTYVLDNSAPNCTISVRSNAEPSQYIKQTITCTDEENGVGELASDNVYKYYYSKSLNSFDSTSVMTYENGVEFDFAKDSDKFTSGIYFIYIEPIKDSSGNYANYDNIVTINGKEYYQAGEFNIDHDKPKFEILPIASNEPQKFFSIMSSKLDEANMMRDDTSIIYYISESENTVNNDYPSGKTNFDSSITVPIDLGLSELTMENVYVYVQAVYDIAGNMSYANSITNVLYNGEIYHRFGPYKLDNISPTVSVTPNYNNTYNKTISVNIKPTDNMSLMDDPEMYKYIVWPSSFDTTTMSTEYNDLWWTDYTPNDDTIIDISSLINLRDNPLGLNDSDVKKGDFYIYIKRIVDHSRNYGMINLEDYAYSNPVHKFGPYKFDIEEPVIEVSRASCAATTSIINMISIDDHLSEDSILEYYLSTSDISLEGGTWTEYQNNTQFTMGTGLTGEYYLFIRQVSDIAGNLSTGGTIASIDDDYYHFYGEFIFDNTGPVMSVETTSSDAVKSLSNIISVTGSPVIGSYQYALSTSSLSITGSWINYTNGSSFTMGTGLNGTYYLFVKQLSDSSGNLSTGGTIVTIGGVNYHRFGTYVFSNPPPSVSFSSFSIDKGIEDFFEEYATVYLSASNATEMCISSSNDINECSWVSYNNIYYYYIKDKEKSTNLTLYGWVKNSSSQSNVLTARAFICPGECHG